MAHFAQIDDNNIVTNVIVINDKNCCGGVFPDSEICGQEFIKKLGLDGIWKQTSYNNNFRLHYANVGSTYDPINDVFIDSQPYNSWILNFTTFVWEPPVPYPDDSNEYYWDENNQQWIIYNTEIL